jgi:hypothetical protein
MPEMTLPFDYTLRSLSGRSVEFKAGEPTYVVPEAVAEAEALGAVNSEAYVAPEAPKQEPQGDLDLDPEHPDADPAAPVA